jgi:hypothetical protein
MINATNNSNASVENTSDQLQTLCERLYRIADNVNKNSWAETGDILREYLDDFSDDYDSIELRMLNDVVEIGVLDCVSERYVRVCAISCSGVTSDIYSMLDAGVSEAMICSILKEYISKFQGMQDGFNKTIKDWVDACK